MPEGTNGRRKGRTWLLCAEVGLWALGAAILVAPVARMYLDFQEPGLDAIERTQRHGVTAVLVAFYAVSLGFRVASRIRARRLRRRGKGTERAEEGPEKRP